MSAGTIAITGAGGFIGSHVTSAMLAAGYEVRALAGAPEHQLADLPPHVWSVKAEIDDRTALDAVFEGAGTVVHLAGPARVALSYADPAGFARAHVAGTAAVLSAATAANVRRFVYASSAEVYGGGAEHPVTEDHPLAPRSPYAAAKAGAEEFVRMHARVHALNAVILRPFLVYGPGMAAATAIGAIVTAVRARSDVVLDDVRPVRDVVYVADVARAFVQAAQITRQGVVTFNLGSGRGISIGQLAACAIRVAGVPLAVRERPRPARPAAAELFRLIADPARAAAELHWTADTPVEAGLAAMLASHSG